MVDNYTKAILAVIAICLAWICVRDVSFVNDAHAAESIRISGTVDVNVEQINGHSFKSYQVPSHSVYLPVKVSNWPQSLRE